jgi:hypothetical protein
MNTSMLTQVNRYLQHRRVLGFRLVTEGRRLRNFARFADRSGRHGVLTNELAIRWAAAPKGHDRFYYGSSGFSVGIWTGSKRGVGRDRRAGQPSKRFAEQQPVG